MKSRIPPTIEAIIFFSLRDILFKPKYLSHFTNAILVSTILTLQKIRKNAIIQCSRPVYAIRADRHTE